MAKSKGPGGERQFVHNSCLECGEEAYPVMLVGQGSRKLLWQCKSVNSHLLKKRNYTVTVSKK